MASSSDPAKPRACPGGATAPRLGKGAGMPRASTGDEGATSASPRPFVDLEVWRSALRQSTDRGDGRLGGGGHDLRPGPALYCLSHLVKGTDRGATAGFLK